MKRPWGIWVVTILAAILALPQLRNCLGGLATLLLTPELFTKVDATRMVFGLLAFPAAALWSVLAFKMRAAAFGFGMLFFVLSLLPFGMIFSVAPAGPQKGELLQALLPVALVWGAFTLGLALWTRKLVESATSPAKAPVPTPH
jgi:hypothetical protein